MDYMYSNQFTVSKGGDDNVIRFAHLAPVFDDEGNQTGKKIVEEKCIVLTNAGIEALRSLLEQLKSIK